jgi:hypothetical protein
MTVKLDRYGPELLKDGDMEYASTSFWTAVQAAPSKEAIGAYEGTRRLRIDTVGATIGGAYQDILEVGKTYRARGVARGDGVNAPEVYIGNTVNWTGTTSTDWQPYDVTGTADSITLTLVGSGAISQSVWFDACSVQEVFEDLTPYEKICRTGAVNAAFVYHVAGYDWAATNSPELAALLDGTPTDDGLLYLKRQLFGWAYILDTPNLEADYPADSVRVLPILDHDQGSQRIDYGEDKGLDVGGWRVTIRSGQTGYTWTKSAATIEGIIGLDANPNETTAGVKKGTLSRSIGEAGAAGLVTVYWREDSGLAAKLSSPGNDAVWVGTNCLYQFSDPSGPTDGEYSCSFYARFLGTSLERTQLDLERQTGFSYITDTPTGLVGQIARLHVVPMTDAGDVLDRDNGPTPILARWGTVAPGMTETDNTYRITHNGPSNVLDREVPVNRFRAHLSGFNLSRYDYGTTSYEVAQLPHIVLWEKETGDDESGEGVTKTEIWLGSLANGGAVRYGSVGELRTAALAALTGATTLCTYTEEPGGNITFDPGSSNVYSVRMFGPVPFLLGWGELAGNDRDTIRSEIESGIQPAWMRYRLKPDALQTRQDHSTDIVFCDGSTGEKKYYNWTGTGGLDSLQRVTLENIPYWLHLRSGTSVYDPEDNRTTIPVGETRDTLPVFRWDQVASYYWQEDLYYRLSTHQGLGLIPRDSSGNRRWYITAEADSRDLEAGAGEVVIFGATDGAQDYSRATSAAEFFRADEGRSGGAVRGIVESVDSTSGTYFVTDTYNVSGTLFAGAFTFRDDAGVFTEGWMGLTWFPGVVGDDPNEITDATIVKNESATEIVQQLWGDPDTDAGVGIRQQLTGIPDLHGTAMPTKTGYQGMGLDSGDRTLIDWGQISEVLEAGRLAGAYSIKLSDDRGKLSVWEALQGVMLSHGGRLTYGYREDQRAYVIGATTVAPDSPSKAAQAGREISGAEILPVAPTGRVGGQWTHNSITCILTNSNGEEQPITAQKRVDASKAARASKPLEINDPFTPPINPFDPAQKDYWETLQARLVSYANNWSLPGYQQEIQTTIAPMATLQVGRSCIYSSDLLRDPETGARGITDGAGELMSMDLRMGAPSAKTGSYMKLVLRISKTRRGLSPHLFIAAGNTSLVGSVVSVTGLGTSPSQNLAFATSSGLTDLAGFGCWRYNEALGLHFPNCGCGAYRVWVFERDTSSLTDLGSSRNVWAGAIAQPTATDLANGTATITLDNTTNFSTVAASSDLVVIYNDSDDGSLQDCQKNYGYLAGSDGQALDSAGEEDLAFRWGMG